MSDEYWEDNMVAENQLPRFTWNKRYGWYELKAGEITLTVAYTNGVLDTVFADNGTGYLEGLKEEDDSKPSQSGGGQA